MDKLAAALSGITRGSSSAAAASSSGGGADGPEQTQRWRGVEYVRVDGSHDSTERLAAVKRFKHDPSVRVALLSITAAAVGTQARCGAAQHRLQPCLGAVDAGAACAAP